MPARRRFRHGDLRVGERRAADARQIDPHDAVLARATGAGDPPRRFQLGCVALPVIDRQRMADEALLSAPSRARSPNRALPTAAPRPRTEPRFTVPRYLPGTLPHRYLCSWIWNRTGRRSSRIQSASSRAGSCSWLGENSTVQTRGSPSSRSLLATPLVVAAAADHELDQVVGRKPRQLVIAVARLFARARRLDVHDLDDARIDILRGTSRHWSRATPVARIAQSLQQRRAVFLRQRLSARDADILRRRTPRRARESRRAPTTHRHETRKRCRSTGTAAGSQSGARTPWGFLRCPPLPAGSGRFR